MGAGAGQGGGAAPLRLLAQLPAERAAWRKDVDVLAPGSVMSAEDLVDAALVGFDKGEIVSIPPLHDVGLWEEMDRIRLALAPHLSSRRVADRYLVA